MNADNYILFTVAGTSYALPSQDVAHVEMVEQITRVPNAPPFVEVAPGVFRALLSALGHAHALDVDHLAAEPAGDQAGERAKRVGVAKEPARGAPRRHPGAHARAGDPPARHPARAVLLIPAIDPGQCDARRERY